MSPTNVHTCTLVVRPYECDVYGHVNNAVYQNYLEFARGEFLKASGADYRKFVEDGFGIWVVEARLSYKFPALPDDELTIETKAIEVRAATASVEQTITKRNSDGSSRVVLTATVKLVWVDANGKPIRIPDDWRTRFEPEESVSD